MALTKLTDIKDTVLETIDVAEEYRQLGLQIVASGVQQGWVPCRAWGKDDQNPSAQICLSGDSIGQYVDFSGGIGEGRSIGFFDFCVSIGKFDRWQEAVKHYALKIGLTFPDNVKDPQKSFLAQDYNDALTAPWAERRNTDSASFRAAGGMLGEYPARLTSRQLCVLLPIYGRYLTADSPIGYVAWRRSGEPFPSNGKRGEVKMLTVEGSEAGLMGKFALERLDQAEIVWKTEGPSDLLALMKLIPESLREKHLVITNSAGCAENPKPWVTKLLEKKTVYIVQDADKPGEAGARKWAEALAQYCQEVRRVELPYPIEPNHGKDLRDWIADGGTYEDLTTLAESSAPVQFVEPEEKDPLKDGQNLLDRIELDVLGENADQSISVFSRHNKKIVIIKDVDKISYAKLIQIAGPLVKNFVTKSDIDENGMMTVGTVKDAIALLGGASRISSDNTKGMGIWLTQSGKTILVGKGEAVVWDGRTLETVTNSKFEDFILNFSSGNTFWPKDLKERLENFDPQDAKDALDELYNLMVQWNWIATTEDPSLPALLVTGLVGATFLQSIFKWRPMVSIVGESESGKTTLVETIVQLFGPLGEKLSSVSEAAVRQYVKDASKPLFLDEFEATANRQKIFELLRTSSDGSKLIRGTQSQGGIAFGLKHIVWTLAIEINLRRAPDANRFIELKLKRPNPGENRLNVPSDDKLRKLGEKLLTALVYYTRSIQIEAKRLVGLTFPGRNSRDVATFIAPAAVVNCLLQTDGALSQMIAYNENKDVLPDQNDLLQTILTTRVTFRSDIHTDGTYTIGYLIDAFWQRVDYDCESIASSLMNFGIFVRNSNQRNNANFNYSDCVFFSKKQTEQLLKGTNWECQSIVQVLNRLDGSIEGKKVVSGFGTLRGVYVPINHIVSSDYQ